MICIRCVILWSRSGHDAIPDETTILNFRHLLEAHNLAEALFDAVSSYLQDRSLLMRGGTIMDATLIAAAPSSKNKVRKRDPQMSQTKKGNQWYFGDEGAYRCGRQKWSRAHGEDHNRQGP